MKDKISNENKAKRQNSPSENIISIEVFLKPFDIIPHNDYRVSDKRKLSKYLIDKIGD
jgi:hypothetical protein